MSQALTVIELQSLTSEGILSMVLKLHELNSAWAG